MNFSPSIGQMFGFWAVIVVGGAVLRFLYVKGRAETAKLAHGKKKMPVAVVASTTNTTTVTPTRPNTPEEKKAKWDRNMKAWGLALRWVVGLAFVALLVLWGISLSNKEKRRAAVRTEVAAIVAEKEANRQSTDRAYIYEAEDPLGFDGEYIHPEEGNAKIRKDDNDCLMFEAFYEDLGRTESVLFILDRSKDEGIWTKQSPKMSGRWKLKNERFQNIKNGYCLTWCSDKSTNTWHGAQLRPL